MTEHELETRIAKLEALFAGTPYDGEKQAAKKNLDRLLDRLHQEQAFLPARSKETAGWKARPTFFQTLENALNTGVGTVS